MREMWRVIDTGLRTAAQNIALNRALLEARQAEEIPSTLRFLRFAPSALLGYHQSAEQEFNLDYCRANQIAVQRRITGGGAIFSDETQLGWELYLHRRDVGASDMQAIARRICHAAATAISALGVDARYRPRHDIEVDGRKISGTGGAFDGDALLYQGTLLIDLDVEKMLRVLRIPAEKLSDKAIASARDRFRLTTPSLFILGFLFIFAIGGLTGVMVAVVPFDLQAHDSYFVVAHFHYVLVGGMVFPLFATFYYWDPMISRNRLSERLGRYVFWLMFVGFNVAFFPMHISGLLGMPRRVWTYSSAMGWDTLNMISTIGAFILALGVLVFVVDIFVRFRRDWETQRTQTNPWDAGTLEWLPSDLYSMRSVPIVTSRYPLWDQPNLAEDVAAGAYYLPNAATGRRETIVTSPIEARPEYLLEMPGPGWAHMFSAVFTAAFFLLLTVKAVAIALVCGALAVFATLVWCWQLDPPPRGRVEIGGGISLPTYMSGPSSHAWWAMIVLILVAGSLYITFVFSYLYLWTVSPQVWPVVGASPLPDLRWAASGASLMLLSILAFRMADRALPKPGSISLSAALLMIAGALCLIAGVGIEGYAQWRSGLLPGENAYGAMVYLEIVLTGQLVATVAVMTGFALARLFTGKLDAQRRVSFESAALLAYYTAAQGLLGFLLIYGFPRMLE